MTKEEALEWSKEMLKQCKDTNEMYILFKGKPTNATTYMTIVTEALEKQVPKKMKHSCCPNCSTGFSFITKNLGNPKGHKTIHCWNCG